MMNLAKGMNALKFSVSTAKSVKPTNAFAGARFYSNIGKAPFSRLDILKLSGASLTLKPPSSTASSFFEAKSANKSTHASAQATTKRKAFAETAAGKVPVFITQGDALKETFFRNQDSEKAIMAKDLGSVRRQYLRWEDQLPGVQPFYAIKCSPDPMILETLASSGAGFDCATSAEIELALKTGVGPNELIFANPVKSLNDIAFARSKGVKKMTFDNVDELYKVHSQFPEAELVLRLLPDDSGSLMKFGSKFGAEESVAVELLQTAQQLGLKVIGVSFHIGSGCYSPEKYDDALAMCRRVFDSSAELGLPPMRFLDIGGGFPGLPSNAGGDDLPFERFAGVIRPALDRYFPAEEFPELQKIGEPGRYFVQTSGVLFAKISGKRVQKKTDDGDKKVLYYINDGVYGSFNCIMYDHYNPVPIPASEYMQKLQSVGFEDLPAVRAAAPNADMATMQMGGFTSPMMQQSAAGFATCAAQKTLGTFFGPTCDSMDKIAQDYPISELHVGDWVVFENMGAYTTAAATRFNGCPLASYTIPTPSPRLV
jgi:ornithine decarboxylase